MKRCPQCYLTFSDENSFCLFDGTTLRALSDDQNEEATLWSNRPQQPVDRRRGRYFIPALSLIAVLFLLLIGLTAYFFTTNKWAGFTDGMRTESSNASQSNTVSEPSFGTPPVETAQQEIERLESETRKLEEARKRLDEEKRKANQILQPTRTTSNIDEATTRIRFRRGSVEESVTGSIVTRRNFVLYTLWNQSLDATLQSNSNCVVFDGGSATISLLTEKGDTYLRIRNVCEGQVSFSLKVYVR